MVSNSINTSFAKSKELLAILLDLILRYLHAKDLGQNYFIHLSIIIDRKTWDVESIM